MNNKWIKLDNAANIFPAVANGPDTKVFRFACELNEEVDPQILEETVAEASEVFDLFNCILKKGLFWYYFEKSDLRPTVREEYKPVCAPLYNREKKELLYEITYYKNRINLEIFHALSDGTGALKFLECIVNKYLAKAHNTPEPELEYDASAYEKEDDGFYRYYKESKGRKKAKVKKGKAYRFRGGSRLPDDRLSVIIGHADLSAALQRAHESNTTLTGYLSATLMCAIKATMPRRAHGLPVVLSIPINLRKYFPTSSARNFFVMANIGYDFQKQPSDMKSVTESVTESLKETLSKENLEMLLSKYSAVENNLIVRLSPLILKDVCLKIAHARGMMAVSGTFSNVGLTKFPEEFAEYVNAFEITCATGNFQVCASSYKNVLSISFTSPYDDYEIQKNFFRALTDNGIHVEITSNTDTFA